MNKILLTAFAFLSLAMLIITLDVFLTRQADRREKARIYQTVELPIRNYTLCNNID